ncbi:hypothetical protein [Arcanobacterium phocae]|uniref:Transmembrane protein n=1 Tax=Arcanobacterium phocae TaxID=131112 RepID=A0A1H2LKW7_9ACTO|nr:hypothetical protein [Arcanobacterium phocae]SDU81385.1 hypothetical protein SAMN04489737_1501 [Arcanobacterium phocae]
MEREDNDLGNLSGWDADKEWQSFISLDNGTRRRGPRDWSSPEADMDFDAADLPTATPQAPASFPRLAVALWILCTLAILVCCAGFFDVISLPRTVFISAAVLACVCAAGGVIAHAPNERDFDDDGARI